MSDCPCADAAAKATDDEASLVGLGTREAPRVAGSAASARVLLDAWRADPDIAAARAAGVEIVSEAATHPCEGEEVACHGRVAYPRETAASGARIGDMRSGYTREVTCEWCGGAGYQGAERDGLQR